MVSFSLVTRGDGPLTSVLHVSTEPRPYNNHLEDQNECTGDPS